MYYNAAVPVLLVQSILKQQVAQSCRKRNSQIVQLPKQRCIRLSLRISFRPEDFLFLDVIIDADSVLDVNDGSEVTGALVLRHDGDVHNLVLLDYHEEGLVLFDARAVITEPVSGSAFASEAERAGRLWGE